MEIDNPDYIFARSRRDAFPGQNINLEPEASYLTGRDLAVTLVAVALLIALALLGLEGWL